MPSLVWKKHFPCANADHSFAGYRVWARVAKDRNGYKRDQRDVIAYSAEIRDPNLTSRLIVDASTLHVSYSGCYASSTGGMRCILPWTLYRVN